MEAHRVLELLHRHQDGLLEHMRAKLAMLDQPPEAVSLALAQARWEALRRMRAYQLFKHTELFDRAVASGSPEQIRLADAMRDRCVVAGKAFVQHVARWSCNDVTGNWAAYQIATRSVIAAVRRHLAGERIEAARLLEMGGEPRRMRA